MFFHVVFTVHNLSKEIVRLDLSEQQLKEAIVDPYSQGKTFLVHGEIISPSQVRRVQVTRTGQPSEVLRRAVRSLRDAVIKPDETSEDLLIFRRGQDVTDSYFSLVQPAAASREEMSPMTTSTNVFVVHGRNDAARSATFSFLRSLGLRPLEWSTVVAATGKGSPYIGEIIDKGFELAQAIVVLMTPDDEARLREAFRSPDDPAQETNLTPQARQNVIYEAGLAMGKNPERTIIVELGHLRPFSDISGMHLIRLNNTTQRRQELALRLKSAGCSVDMSGTDWHTAGDFFEPMISR